jgi:DNA-binding SARP family transcriptional activator/Tfp pilus assembly protein PilF
MSFAARLRHHRERAGLTQFELAERAGLSLAAVRDLEQARSRAPRPSSIRALVAALGVDAEALAADPRPAPAPPPEPDGDVRIVVLGPLEAFIGAAKVELGDGRHHLVLIRLALTPNLGVQRDELVDLLWGGRVPPSAVNLVQTYVSRLRRALEPKRAARGESRLFTLARGAYRLNVDDDQLDLLQFRRLAQRAADHEALPLLEEALSLWRGGPELPDTPLVTLLHDEYLGLVLRHADLAQQAGRPELALPRLRELAARHRLHEPLHARLVITLAAAGHQAEALSAYDDIRRELTDELGIDPGPDLVEAHRGVLQRRWLRTAPRPEPPRPAPLNQTPAPPSDFTGRKDHLEQVTGLLQAGAVCTISGVAGAGKTALALQAAQRLRTSFPDGQLYIDLQGAGPQRAVAPVDALARFLRALGVEGRRIPAEEAESAALFRSTLAERKMLVILDNARDAAQVRPLLPGPGGATPLITSRRTLADLAGAKLVSVGGLAPDEALDLLVAAAGEARIAADPDAARELADLCGLLPIALRVAAGQLSAGSAWTVQSLVDRLRELHVGDTAVSAGFQVSYADLTPAAARAFRLLTLVPGADFTAEAAAAVVGADAHAAIGELLDGNLLQSSLIGRFRYHDLLRLFAASRSQDDPDGVRAEALDRLLAWCLDHTAAAVRLIYPEMVRLPYEPGHEFADAREAYAWLDAEIDGIVAAVSSGQVPAGPFAWRIADQLRGYFFVRRTGVPWLATAEAGLAAAEAAGDAWARAAMHQTLGQAYWSVGRHEPALREYQVGEELAEKAGWHLAAVYLRHNIGLVQAELGRLAEAQESYRRALETSSAHGFRHVQAVTLNDLGAMCHDQGRLDEAVDYFTRALQINTGLARRKSALANHNNLGMMLRQLGQVDGALDHLTAALSGYREIGEAHGEMAVLDELSQLHTQRGHHAAAVSAARNGLDITRHTGDKRAESALLSTVGEALLGAGTADEALRHFQEAYALANRHAYPYFQTRAQIGLARAHLALGDTEHWRLPARNALSGARAGGYRLLEADALMALTRGALADGRPTDAQTLCRSALQLYRAAGSPVQEAEALRLLEPSSARY